MHRFLLILLFTAMVGNFCLAVEYKEQKSDHPKFEEYNELYEKAFQYLRIDLDSSVAITDSLEHFMSKYHGDTIMLQRLLTMRANIEYLVGDFSATLKIGKRLLKIAEDRGDILGILLAKGTIGNAYSMANMPKLEMRTLHESVLLFESWIPSIAKSDTAQKEKAAHLKYTFLSNLAYAYYLVKDWKMSNKYDELALGYFESKQHLLDGDLNLKRSLAMSHSTLYKSRYEIGKTKAAEESYTISFAILSEIEDLPTLAMIQKTRANILVQQEKIDSALHFYAQARNILFKEPFYKTDLLDALNQTADAYYKKGDFKNATKWLNTAREQELESSSLLARQYNHSIRWNILRDQGKFQEALNYYEKYVSITDSIRFDEREKEIIRGEMNFQLSQEKLKDSLKIVDANTHAEKNALERDQEREKNNIYIWAGSFIGLGALAFILFALNRNRIIKRQKEQLNREFNHLKEFTENASHEMQTPVAVIHSKLEKLLNNPRLTQKELQDIDIVANSAEQLSKLNRTLLLLSKIENNQFPLSENIDASQKVSDQIFQLSDIISATGLKIDSNLETTQLTGNNLLFDMFLSNLLSNAIKYNLPNGKIWVELMPNRLVVSNTGEDLKVEPEHLFKRFARNDGQEIGTGLGLSIVKKICESHNWSIRYEQENGKHILITDFSS